MNYHMLLPKVFLCFVAMGVLSACEAIIEIPIEVAAAVREASREIDTRGAWGVKTAKNSKQPILPMQMIKPGETTKTEVLDKLRIPEEKTSDDRFFLYRYQLQTHKVQKKDKIVVERIPVGRLRKARFLIWFDPADTVKRYRWHECERTRDPKCHDLNDTCEMIKGLNDEKLIPQYCCGGCVIHLSHCILKRGIEHEQSWPHDFSLRAQRALM